MMNILSVAEKPSVARELTRIIAGVPHEQLKRQSYSPFNPVFDIESCMFQNRNAKMKMTSVSGHLMEIEFDAAHKSWGSCNPIELFTAPIKKEVKDEFAQIKRTLVEEARHCNVLLLWLDCDLEGENIAFEVMSVCLQANPRMDVYRARFSALIDRDIRRTMQFPDRPNALMNDAVDARQEIDLRIGAAFTRFQTLRLRSKYENIGTSIISYGPCQFPTLGFVVDRDLRIKAFRPENFWYLSCDVEFPNPDKDDGSKLTCTFTWDRTRVYDKLACLILYEMCLEDGRAVVTHCTERPTSKFKPIPLNTVELQKRASRHLRLGSERTMAVAEALYQRGILSYPRTETDFFKEGFELHPLIQDHRGHSQWGAFATQLLDANGFEPPRAGTKDDQAHPPIHPTKCVELQTLENDDERKVYDLVVRHFLACCSRDARGSQSKVSICIPPKSEVCETFSATGLMVLEKNWLEVYGKYEYWTGSKVPKFAVNEIFTPKRLVMLEGRTCPPEPIAESDLITAMDTHGIGTDATIAAHIATIQQREYVVKDAQNRFVATKLGLALMEGYNSMGYQLNKPQLRAAIEADCKKVSQGQMRKEEAVKKCLDTMKECFVVCNREAGKLDESMARYFQVLGAGGVDPTTGAENYITVIERLTKCGVCQSLMDLRCEGAANARTSRQEAKDGRIRFLYCTTCVKSFVVPPKGELSAHEVSCVLCGFQVLNVKNTGTAKQHTICPHCFSNPPAPPVGVESSSDFRCFLCAKEECELSGRLAGAEVDIAACSDARCTGQMRLKKAGKSSGLMVGCTIPTCKSVWWLPKFVRSAVPGDMCARCHAQQNLVRKLNFSIIMSKAPPFLDPECTVCPVCDSMWSRLDMPALALKKLQNNTRGRGVAAAAGAGGGAGGQLQQQTLLFNNLRSAAGGPPPGAHPAPHNPVPYQVPHQAAVSIHQPQYHPPPQAQQHQQRTGNGNGAAETPLCGCGVPSKLLTTTKEGPNMGRTFFACSKLPKDKCNYFQWCDAMPLAPSAAGAGGFVSHTMNQQSRTSAPPNRNNTVAIGSGGAGGVNCKCNEPAVLLTVSKEGPNKGRKFYSCSKRDGKCQFFQWEDA